MGVNKAVFVRTRTEHLFQMINSVKKTVHIIPFTIHRKIKLIVQELLNENER